MTGLRERAKAFVLTHAPQSVLMGMKKRHYVRAVREFAEPDAAVVAALVSPGDRVVDIGANAGWYTRVLSERVGSAGSVTSIEPVPPTFEILAHCVDALGLSNVALHNCALSSSDGVVSMEVPDYDEGGENFYQARIVAGGDAASGHTTYRVETRTLDGMLADSDAKVRFIKCDVEGHELSVIEGATRIIEGHRPAWLLEVWGDPDEPGSMASRIVGRLADWGYAPWWLDGQTVRRRKTGDESVNYFFFTDEQVEGLEFRTSGDLQIAR